MTTTITGFTLTKFVIIESLDATEMQTGASLAEYIRGVGETNDLPITVELTSCGNSNNFREIFHKLTLDAQSGEIPVVDDECHGHPAAGLLFADGSNMPWTEVAALSLKLNIACRFNLLVRYSACFGGYFLQEMGTITPSPCWCVIAPTESVNPAEIMRGLRLFYEALIRTLDIGKAIAQLQRETLTHGRWFAKAAEIWFQQLTIYYIEHHCIRAEMKKRVMLIHEQLKKRGKIVAPALIEIALKEKNRANLTTKYFDRYFLIDEIPENAQRFVGARIRLLQSIDKLRASGRYLI